MLEGGRSYAAVSKDCVCKKLEKAGATHNVMETSEIRVLQQTKLELEQQLKGEIWKHFYDVYFFDTSLFSPPEQLISCVRSFLIDAEALNKQHDAMSQAMKLAARNEELEKELRDIDHVALAVEADCNSAVKENNRRVCRLQV